MKPEDKHSWCAISGAVQTMQSNLRSGAQTRFSTAPEGEIGFPSVYNMTRESAYVYV